MKTKILKLFILLAVFLPLISCVPDEDIDPDGSDARDKFIGEWLFVEAKSTGWYEKAGYTVIISRDPGNSSQVLLKNFANVGRNHSAYGIVTSKRISIPTQDITGNGFVTSGTGNMISNTFMNWEFTYVVGGDQESVTASATKK
ncbi:MAG: hypothetical protein PHX54_14085 [Lentimicrobiaceae bacterium]|nr:hypothetical protein [Lentimicrobiaceae bacterium]